MLRDEALDYHASGRPGKVQIAITKSCVTQRDLALAYTPGVAEPVREIEKNPLDAFRYTARGNLVAVVSNGTAVLGLGDVGPLAGKPVMEGKSLLFKRFADVDVFDIEIDAHDPDDVVRIVKALEPTFGGINLEDIKAPECFEIERRLAAEMDIPVFHDDQHGTAIISGAALLNALEVAGKSIDEVRMAVSGAGAAAIACCEFFVQLGMRREHMTLGRHAWRHLQGPGRPHGSVQDDVRGGHNGPHTGRRHGGRRRLPGRLGGRCCLQGDGQVDGRPSDRVRAGQSRPRDRL